MGDGRVTARSRARARMIDAALARHPIDTERLWPRLDTVSAWADGVSRPYAKSLAQMLPHALLQPKGLLATESAVTIAVFGVLAGSGAEERIP